MAVKYPEHEKLKAAKKTDDATQLVKNFLDWLRENGCVFAEWDGDRGDFLNPWSPEFHTSDNAIIAAFFNIDEKKLDDEKRAMLDELAKTEDAVEGE